MKRILILILTIVVLLSACSSTQRQEQHLSEMLNESAFRVYLNSHAETNLFKAETIVYESEQTDVPTSNYALRIQLPVADNDVQMEYTRSAPLAHEYQSADGKTVLWLDTINGNPYMFRTQLTPLLANRQINTQTDLEQLTKEIVSCYCQEDWSTYTVSCTTNMRVSTENTLASTSIDGFSLAEKTGDEVGGYTLTYRRMIGDLALEDKIELSVYFRNDYLRIVFSPHKFDEIREITLDQQKVDASIDAFLAENLIADSTLISYQKVDPTICRDGNKLLYKCRLLLEVHKEGYDKLLNFHADVIVDPEISVTDKAVLSPVRPYTVLETAPVTESVK